jgi:hypothetical protein
MNYTSKEKPAPFIEKISLQLEECWYTDGSISCWINQIREKEFELIFCPAYRELYGGANDGEKIFPGFIFNVGKFMKIFNRNPVAPKLVFDCWDRDTIEHLLFNGYVDGNHLKIAVLRAPPNDLNAIEKLYTVGPKTGTVEPIEYD